MSVTCGLPLNGAMASAINVLDDVHWSLFNEWTAKATDGKKSDKPLIRLPIPTHFFTAIIVDRMLVIHLNEQVAGPALEGLNAFIRSSGRYRIA